MITGFDRIEMAVPALAPAVADLGVLLGTAPVPVSAPRGPARAWLGLANTVIELVQRPVPAASISAVVLRDDTFAGPDAAVDVPAGGPPVRRSDGSATAAWRHAHAAAGALAVDHIVLHARDAHACSALFSGALGMRLALDRTVPEWGGRMLFFRCGKLTLEVIERGGDGAGPDAFWGIAYRVPDLDAFVRGLRERGGMHSAVRKGRKPGTRVATVKSHCLGIPTLLIEPAPPAVAAS